MNCESIIKRYLIDYGYDGLINKNGGCGCTTDNLFPCMESFSMCEPAYKKLCKDCNKDCEYREDVEFCMVKRKNYKK